MLTTNNEHVYLNKPWSKKASVFLLIAEKVSLNLNAHADTYEVCEKAITDCWTWMSDREAMLPSKLAYYVDSDETSFGSLDELRFERGSVEQHSLIFIVMVIGYFAHKAYWVAGIPKQMSESVCESGEDLVSELVRCSDLLGYKSEIDDLLG